MHRKSLSTGALSRTTLHGELTTTLPRPLYIVAVGWGGETPSPHSSLSTPSLDLGAYGASNARPLPLKIPGYAYAVYNMQLRNICNKHIVCPIQMFFQQ